MIVPDPDDRMHQLAGCVGLIRFGRAVFATPGALESDTLVITESPIDALSLATVGIASIATIGTSWPDWLVSFARRKKHTLIGFDNDEPGHNASVKLFAELSSIGANASRLLPSKKDWNEILLTDGLISLKSEVSSFISNGYFPMVNISNSTTYRNLNF